MPISAKSLIYKAIAYAQGIDLYSYTGIEPAQPKALRALDSYRCRPPVALHCAQMRREAALSASVPGNGPNRPPVPLQCPRPCLPIAAGTAPALRPPSEYQQLIIQLFKKC